MTPNFTPSMIHVLSSIGRRAVDAHEIGANGLVLKRLAEMGFLKVDLPRSGYFPPIYSLSEKGEGAAAVLNAPIKPRDCEGDVAKVKRLVANHFRIPLEEMVSARRSRSVARPRQVAMYLTKRTTGRSLPDIGRFFGDRDHTTVLHAVRKIESLMNEDNNFKDEVETLKAEVVSEQRISVVDKPEENTCLETSHAPLESSMRYLRRIDDPSARKTIIMSKWERGEITPQQAERLIHEHGLENA